MILARDLVLAPPRRHIDNGCAEEMRNDGGRGCENVGSTLASWQHGAPFGMSVRGISSETFCYGTPPAAGPAGVFTRLTPTAGTATGKTCPVQSSDVASLIVFKTTGSGSTWFADEAISRPSVTFVKELNMPKWIASQRGSPADKVHQTLELFYSRGGLSHCCSGAGMPTSRSLLQRKTCNRTCLGDSELNVSLASKMSASARAHHPPAAAATALVGAQLNFVNSQLKEMLAPVLRADDKGKAHAIVSANFANGFGRGWQIPRSHTLVIAHVRANHVKHAMSEWNLPADGTRAINASVLLANARKRREEARTLMLMASYAAQAIPHARLLLLVYEDMQLNVDQVFRYLLGVADPSAKPAPRASSPGTGGAKKRSSDDVRRALSNYDEVIAHLAANDGCLREMLDATPEAFLAAVRPSGWK